MVVSVLDITSTRLVQLDVINCDVFKNHRGVGSKRSIALNDCEGNATCQIRQIAMYQQTTS